MKKIFSFFIICVMALSTACISIDPNVPDDPTEPNIPENPSDTILQKDLGSNKKVAVDLGLSVKWATCDASKPEEYGDYFAWGETTPKSINNWSTYKWCNGDEYSLTKYCYNKDQGIVDNKTILDLSDDAARVQWGGSLRMPTDSEMTELKK